MLSDCPHCHATVLLLQDGRCPACGKNSRDLKGATPHLTRVVLRDEASVLGVCLGCGQPTAAFEAFKRSRRLGGESSAAKVLLFLVGLFRAETWELLIDPQVAGTKQTVQVTFGRCERCVTTGPVQEVHVDFTRRHVTLLAHRAFAARAAAALG